MFKHLSISTKLAVVISAVAVPLLAAALLATRQGCNRDLRQAELEIQGNTVQRPLLGLLAALPQHQWSVAAAAAPAVQEQEALIDQYLAELDTLPPDLRASVQFTDAALAKSPRANLSLALFRAAWQQLKIQQPGLSPGESATRHAQLLATVRGLIAYVGDTATLGRDPDLDSGAVRDVTLQILPQTLEDLATLATHATTALGQTSGRQIGAEFSRLAVQAALVKDSAVDRLNTALATARAEDNNFYGPSESLQSNLQIPLQTYNAAVPEFLALFPAAAANPTGVTAAQFQAAGQKALAASITLWKTAANELSYLITKRAQAIRTTRNLAGAGCGGGLVLALLLAVLVGRSLTRPVAALTRATERFSKGDATVQVRVSAQDDLGRLAAAFNTMIENRNRIQTQSETEYRRLQASIKELLLVVSAAADGHLGVRAKVAEGALGQVCDALNQMLDNVSELIANTKHATYQVAAASTDITAVAQDLESGEERQSTGINDAGTGVRDLNGQAQTVLQNCQAATQATEQGRQAAQEGAQAVREVITGMERIRENTQVNAKKIKRMGAHALEIAGIVRVIGDNSAKTDMLVLNASIEASRAGEPGRGFSIVAEQVRSMADRTKTLTSQIDKLVHDIQQETGEALAQMEMQTQEVETGARAAASAGGRLENIVAVSSESAQLVAEINASANQQATRTREMLQNVDTMSQVLTEASNKVRETRTTSEQLLVLSAELNKRLDQFHLQSVEA